MCSHVGKCDRTDFYFFFPFPEAGEIVIYFLPPDSQDSRAADPAGFEGSCLVSLVLGTQQDFEACRNDFGFVFVIGRNAVYVLPLLCFLLLLFVYLFMFLIYRKILAPPMLILEV